MDGPSGHGIWYFLGAVVIGVSGIIAAMIYAGANDDDDKSPSPPATIQAVAPTQAPVPTVFATKTPSASTETEPESDLPTSPEEASALFGGSPSRWDQKGWNGWHLSSGSRVTITVPPGWRIDYPAGTCDSPSDVGLYGPASEEVTIATLWYVPNEQGDCGR